MDNKNTANTYRLFDGYTNQNDVSRYYRVDNVTPWIIFYNPNPLKVSKITLLQLTAENFYYTKGLKIQGGHDGVNWTDLITLTGLGYTANLTINVNSPNFYKYYAFVVTDRAYHHTTNAWIGVEMQITATEQVTRVNHPANYLVTKKGK